MDKPPKDLEKRYMEVIRFIRRNLVSISFPVFTTAVIYFDWSHTRNWKLQQKEQN